MTKLARTHLHITFCLALLNETFQFARIPVTHSPAHASRCGPTRAYEHHKHTTGERLHRLQRRRSDPPVCGCCTDKILKYHRGALGTTQHAKIHEVVAQESRRGARADHERRTAAGDCGKVVLRSCAPGSSRTCDPGLGSVGMTQLAGSAYWRGDAHAGVAPRADSNIIQCQALRSYRKMAQVTPP